MTKYRDASTVFGDLYSQTAPGVIGDLHSFLIETLESKLTPGNDNNLVILGPGGQVLPYSCQYTNEGKLGESNRDNMKKMIGNGNILLVDYLLDENKNGLEKAASTLNAMGFFDTGYFNESLFSNNHVDALENNEPTICYLLNNMRDDLKIADNVADAVDATLSIHHASVTRNELSRVYDEIFRILKPGGFIHLGEGNVDMNYAEDKIIKIGKDLSSVTNKKINLIDEREKGNGYLMNSCFMPNEKYSNLPVATSHFEDPEAISVQITEDGVVTIRGKKPGDYSLKIGSMSILAEQLEKIGYSQMLVFGNGLSFPLIDQTIPEDVEKLIIPVDTYYDAITEKLRQNYSMVDQSIVSKVSAGIEYERGNARRGTVEYYTGEEQILKTLEDIGFIDIDSTHHKVEPFYNITAVKPFK